MQSRSIQKFLYRSAWDTRCRSADVSRLLRPYLDGSSTLVDAGCGEFGLAAFLHLPSIVGVDVLPSATQIEGFHFVHGSILSLPFEDRQFSWGASVDVLEHLPATLRVMAVRELVRVARHGVIFTFPSGEGARRIDESYAERLGTAGEAVPDWLEEHLRSEYPDAQKVTDLINAEAQQTGRAASVTISYSEPLHVAARLREISLHSKYLYLLANLAAGALMPAIPKASQANAYRAIVLARFHDE